MFKFIKKLFAKKENDFTVKPTVNEYPLGAILNEHDIDTRDIPLVMVQSPVELPAEYETDLSMFPVFDQGARGTCVPHAYVLIKMFLDWFETKKIKIYSRRFVYVLARVFSGLTEVNGEGLSPRPSAKVMSTSGTIEDDGRDINTLSHSKYVGEYEISDTMRKVGVINRSGKYAFPFHDLQSIKQAVFQNKLVAVTIGIDWKKISMDGTVHIPKNLAGTHEVVICGYSDATEKFKFRNSWSKYWGTDGYGYINYEEIEQVVYDAIVFTDVPNDLIERAKNFQFIFTTDMKISQSGKAIKELQRRLIEYGLLDDIADGKFGLKTFNAVQEFQKLRGIQTTGYVGTITRSQLNEETPAGKTKSKLDLWCEAGIRMEGAKPSIKNPGNIKCSAVMHKNAIDIDPRGFCIFPTYEVGYNALRNQFIRAATTGSTNYKPTMTLYEFYAVYAPDNDGNNSRHYAEVVAQHIGVLPTTQIKSLV